MTALSALPPYAEYQHWDELAAFAAREHALRAERYPQNVADGKLTQADADEDLAIWADIAFSWVDGLHRLRGTPPAEPVPSFDRHQRVEALCWAIKRQQRRVARLTQPPEAGDPKALRLGGLEALLWHEREVRNFLWHVEVTLLGRAQAAERIAADDRRAA